MSLPLCLSSSQSVRILSLILLQVSAAAGIAGGGGDGNNGGGIPPTVAATAQQFPVPPPPEMYQSEENLRAYAYEGERAFTLSGEDQKNEGSNRKKKGRVLSSRFLEIVVTDMRTE